MTQPRTTGGLIIAGGGTGGHISPGLAVVETVLARFPHWPVTWLGSTRPLESGFLAPFADRIEHVALPVLPWREAKSRPLRFLGAAERSYRRAVSMLRQRSPRALLGLGGYISAPGVLAAWRCRVPIVLLEQNVLPGRATRWLQRFAAATSVSFEETRARLQPRYPVVVTGNPIRRGFRDLNAMVVQQLSNTDAAPACRPFTLLVLGGSLGSEAIDAAMLHLLKADSACLTGCRVWHQASGGEAADQLSNEYRQWNITAETASLFSPLAERLTQADLVICRGGATTLAELAAAGVPACLVPWRKAVDDHQWANVQPFVASGGSVLLDESTGSERMAAELAALIRDLRWSQPRRTQMRQAMLSHARPNAADEVVDLIVRLGRA
jgi:UDP-N-acetylglucosamine--N-acetylmuramyl-(pentapeptide) pyrophosphoryl-undecaprenol N-acetylglucosamine transferase